VQDFFDQQYDILCCLPEEWEIPEITIAVLLMGAIFNLHYPLVQFLDRIQDMLKQMAQRFEQIQNLKRFVWMDWFLEAPLEGLVMKLYPQRSEH